MQDSILIRALLKKPVERTPVWIMRQAGRYLPEYLEVRKIAQDFMTLCKTPELACQVTMQPLDRFDLDAAILFSDILTIPDAMGLGLKFVQNEGPVFTNPIRTKSDIDKLPIPDVGSELKYVTDAVSLIKSELLKRDSQVPLIGFSGSPWTLATYMVEGGTSKTFSKVKALAYSEPQLMHSLLDKLVQSIESYLIAQIEAGADVCMIFDTWGGILTKEGYLNFSLDYMARIVNNIKSYCAEKNKVIPVVLFTKQAGQWLEFIADSGCDAVGIDWTVDMADATSRVGHKVAIQGNLDPSVLYAKPEIIKRSVAKTLNAYSNNKLDQKIKTGHVFNLGHGIYPDVNPENVKIMVDAVREYSQA